MGREDVYAPSLKWFHLMDTFMRKTKEKRSSQSKLNPLFINITITVRIAIILLQQKKEQVKKKDKYNLQLTCHTFHLIIITESNM